MSARTGKELLLATKPYAVDSTARSWWHILSTGLLVLATFGGTLLPMHWAARLACSVAAGLMTLRMFVIYHDQQHHAILPRSKAAEWLMQIFGVLVLSPSSIWRSSHNHHHNHNSKLRGAHIGSFPIMTVEQFRTTTPAKRFKYLFMRHPITILNGYVFIFLFGMCVYPFINQPSRHYDSIIAFVVHVALAVFVTIFASWSGLLFTILIPFAVACAIGSYLFYAQHNFPTVTFSTNAGWTYETAALTSSSFMKMNPIMRWFTANIGYHHIHHLNARIPFYRLPEVMEKFPELKAPKTTSLSPLEIYRCLRLKAWDVDAQRMVGLREAMAAR